MLDKETEDLDAIDATILAEVGRLQEELSAGQRDTRAQRCSKRLSKRY